MLGVRALGQGPGVLQGTVEDADRTDAPMAQVLHGQGRHLPGAHDHDVAILEPAERFAGEVGAQRHEGVGGGAERGFLTSATSGADRGMEQPGEGGVGGIFAVGTPKRFPHLGDDLRLAQHHRVEPARHREQVVGGVLLPVGVQGLAQLLGRDVPGLDQQALQGQEPGVVVGDVTVDLDPVAGGQDHGAVDAVQIVRAPVRLGEVVVGECEPLQQLDRCATEGDPEGEDGHGR